MPSASIGFAVKLFVRVWVPVLKLRSAARANPFWGDGDAWHQSGYDGVHQVLCHRVCFEA